MRFIIISIFYFILLIIPVLFSYYIDTDILFYFDVYSLIIFISSILFFYFQSKENIIVISYIVFGVTATLLLSLLVESGAYLFEIQEISYTTGLTSKAALQCFLFLFGAILFTKFTMPYTIKVVNINHKLFILLASCIRLVIILCLFGLIYIGIKYGTPKDFAIHRGDYWGKIAPAWGKWLLDNVIQLIFLLGFLFAKRKKKLDLLLALLVLLVIVWLGERASGTMYFVFYFSIPIFILNIKHIKLFTFKKVIGVVSSFLVLVLIFFASYSSSLSQEEIINKTIDRLAAQPQMWWALDRISKPYPQENIFFSKYLGIGEEKRYSGTYYLMDQVAKKEIVDERYENNGTFTSSGFMNNPYLFGYYLGSFINIILGILIGFIAFLLKQSILSNNLLSLFISFKFYLKFQVMILEGNMTNIFTINTFLFIFIIFIFLKYIPNIKQRVIKYD